MLQFALIVFWLSLFVAVTSVVIYRDPMQSLLEQLLEYVVVALGLYASIAALSYLLYITYKAFV